MAWTPSVNAVASSIMCANASWVSTSPRVARIAAVDSALPGERAAHPADVDDVGVTGIRVAGDRRRDLRR